MRFGVLAPMPSELRPVVKAFGLRRGRSGSLEGHVGRAGEADVVATTTGIGTELATTAAQRMLDRGEVDHVVVVGIAGGIGPTTAVPDLIIPEAVVDWPELREHRPAPLGRLVGAGTIVSSDEYGYPPEVIADFIARGVVAVDMETVAVARVCADAGIPWSAVRAISDRADDDTVDQDVITLVKPDGSPDLGRSLRYLIRHPGRISRLAALGRDASTAARVAATAAAAACAAHSVGE
ncbi:MAG: 5'-methylthioadenosine/S-adenosylhomocysteine nucleosidase [Acidimicrobiales bacterium]